MDLREKKTRANITNAFLQLRSQKPLERITVKELAELAQISKATFYLHYSDIYALSEELQHAVIQNLLAGLEHPEHCLTDSEAFTRALFHAFYAQQPLIETLFSGSQAAVLPLQLEKSLQIFVHQMHPDIDPITDMLLTYTIQGSYYTFQKHGQTCSMQELIRIVGCASRGAMAAAAC